ncbi:hypothetical protein SAVERM_1118 [Streptomyces avermitilis MA-4680 = NBRC 14893]|uniref:Uncharacterized protein n=1 Tax=Streptomyces avermitilis (strain ATCC 31267 / DSM 46492 / JCM 5070 / NBRC 14893 / NCIMB 12804 / NRRL 8165 / MA-4680) TaxID=227882 RepID=Q82P15_STRAW|nr:hypothetical protein SAVERM_1118 [Streptomyces avermitilis MA-4680 = NBRC 14893]
MAQPPAAERAAGAGIPAPSILVLSPFASCVVQLVRHEPFTLDRRVRHFVGFPHLTHFVYCTGFGELGLLVRARPVRFRTAHRYAEPDGPDQSAGDHQTANKSGKHVEYITRRGQ